LPGCSHFDVRLPSGSLLGDCPAL